MGLDYNSGGDKELRIDEDGRARPDGRGVGGVAGRLNWWGNAGVAELADALDLGSRGRKAVQVQLLSPAFHGRGGGWAALSLPSVGLQSSIADFTVRYRSVSQPGVVP